MKNRLQLDRPSLYRWSLLLASIVILGAAGLLTNGRIERAFLGEASRGLEWGPSLLRAAMAVLAIVMLLMAALWKPYRKVPRSPFAKPVGEPEERGVPWGALLAMSFIALVLRLWCLDSQLWLDEIVLLVRYAREPLGHIVTLYDSQNQHILYTILASLSITLFGDSVSALRLPAMAFGVGSVWALYLLGHELTTRHEALLAAALMTVSYHHVWFSQNARGYTGLLFCTLLSSWLLVRGLRRGSPALWSCYALVLAMGSWLHMTMVFVVIGHFLIYILMVVSRRKEAWPGRWEPLSYGFFGATLLTILVYALVLPQMFGGVLVAENPEAANVEMWTKPLWTIMQFIRGLQIGLGTTFGVLVAGAVFGTGLWSYARDRSVLVPLLLLPASIGAAVVMAFDHHLWPRFFFFTLGFGLLVTIRGAFRLSELMARREERAELFGWLACLGLIALSTASLRGVYGPKQDYEGALRFVEASRYQRDKVVTVGLATFPYRHYFHMPWYSADTVEELDGLRAAAKRTWVLFTLPPQLESERPDLMTEINEGFELIKTFEGTLEGGAIYVRRSATIN